MKKLILPLVIVFSLISCAKEWTEAEKNQYRQDCLSMAQGIENIDEICDCGLRKAMEQYSSMEEAQKAVQNMTEEEVEAFFAECM